MCSTGNTLFDICAKWINIPNNNLVEKQVTVWGDYGRIEGRKVFMGVAQILLDDLDLSNIVIGWYKLFGTASLVSLPPSQSQPQQQQQQQQPLLSVRLCKFEDAKRIFLLRHDENSYFGARKQRCTRVNMLSKGGGVESVTYVWLENFARCCT